jgi:hypothetical protein
MKSDGVLADILDVIVYTLVYRWTKRTLIRWLGPR